MSDSFDMQVLSQLSSTSKGSSGSQMLSFAANKPPETSFSTVYREQNNASEMRSGRVAPEADGGQNLPRERSRAASERQDQRARDIERRDRHHQSNERAERKSAQTESSQRSHRSAQQAAEPQEAPATDVQARESAVRRSGGGSSMASSEQNADSPEIDGTSSAATGVDVTGPSDARVLAGEAAVASTITLPGVPAVALSPQEIAEQLRGRLPLAAQGGARVNATSAPLTGQLAAPAIVTESGTAITTGPQLRGLEALTVMPSVTNGASLPDTPTPGNALGVAGERGVSQGLVEGAETDVAVLARQLDARGLHGISTMPGNSGATTGPTLMSEINPQKMAALETGSRQIPGEETLLRQPIVSAAMNRLDADPETAGIRQAGAGTADPGARGESLRSTEWSFASASDRGAPNANAAAADRMMAASSQATGMDAGDWSRIRDGIGAVTNTTTAQASVADSAPRAPVARVPEGGAVLTAVGASPGMGVSAANSSVSGSTGSGLVAEYTLQRAPQDPEFAGELSTRVKTLLRDGVREARLQLNPAELGRLHVTITTDGDQARVAFVADNPAAKEAIEQSMPRLREMLEQGGLQLAQSDVGQRSFGADAGDADAGFAAEEGGLEQADADSSDTAPDTDTRGFVSAPGLLDTYI